jgi:hypothetical protein
MAVAMIDCWILRFDVPSGSGVPPKYGEGVHGSVHQAWHGI